MKCIVVHQKRTYASPAQQILLCLYLKLTGQYNKEGKHETVLLVEEAVSKRQKKVKMNHNLCTFRL